MRGFQAWPKDPIQKLSAEEEAEVLLQRSREISTLMDVTQPQVLENLKKTQEIQEKIQNNRENPRDKSLDDGTSVYVRNLKIQNKLNAYAHGCYKIVGRTAMGNYILENRVGKQMKQTYPISRLKVVEPDPEESEVYEVEKILDHRSRRGKLEYFVKWKGYSDSECSWVKESNFDTTEVIEEYWEARTMPPEDTQIPVNMAIITSTYLTCNPISMIRNYVTLICIIMALSPAQTNGTLINTTTIKGDFLWCNTSEKKLFQRGLDCKSIRPPEKTYQSQKWSVLHQRDHPIEGETVFCEISEIEIVWKDHFFSADTRTRTEKHLSIGREDCIEMARTLKCFGEQMSCLLDTCEYTIEPNPQFVFWGTDVKTTRHCKLNKRRMSADSENEIIAVGPKGPCYAKDLTCVMHKGIMTWISKIDNQCPYELVDTLRFQQIKDILLAGSITHPEDIGIASIIPSLRNGALQAVTNKYNLTSGYILLQLVNSFETCGETQSNKNKNTTMTVFQTRQGLLVTTDKRAQELPKAVYSSSLIEQLNLADGDYTNYMYFERDTEHHRIIMQIHCEHAKIMHQLHALQDNTFLRHRDLDNNDLVIFSQKGLLYVPQCYPVRALSLLTNLTKCYKDIPIKVGNTTGFLKQGQIIASNSEIIDCAEQNRKVNIGDKIVIHTIGNQVNILPITARQIYVSPLNYYESATYNIHHNPILTKNFDIITNHEKLDSVFDTGYHFEILKNQEPQTNSTVYKVFGIIFDSFHDFQQKILTWISSSISLLVIIVAVICILIYLLRYKKSHRTFKTDLEEMVLRLEFLKNLGRRAPPTAPTLREVSPIEIDTSRRLVRYNPTTLLEIEDSNI